MKTNFTTILFAVLCLCYSCKSPVPTVRSVAAARDTIKIHDTVTVIKKTTDTVAKAKAVQADPEDLYAKSKSSCPVSLKKCSLVNGRAGLKDIIVSLQNRTSKKISMVKIGWLIYNRSGKRVGYSTGLAKKEVAKGKSASYSWDVDTHAAFRAKAFICSLRYKDGSRWAVE